LKNKILAVGDAIVSDKTFEIIEKYLHVVKIEPTRLKSILSNETDFKAIWIHLDTFIDESLLATIKEIPYLVLRLLALLIYVGRLRNTTDLI